MNVLSYRVLIIAPPDEAAELQLAVAAEKNIEAMIRNRITRYTRKHAPNLVVSVWQTEENDDE